MKLVALDHVQIAIPPLSEDRARGFYVGVLGFTEVELPAALEGRKSIWFASGPINLHVGVETDFVPAKKAHPAFVVEGLDEITANCLKANLQTRPDVPLNGFRRVHIFDPFGNRIELMEKNRCLARGILPRARGGIFFLLAGMIN